VDEVLVIFKAYVTRVGSGPLKGEVTDEEATRRGWREVGTVTGRPRRVAPFNYELAKRAVVLNSGTQIAVTKIDIVFPECAGVRRYEDLSEDAKRFVEKVESVTGIPVTLIGTGADVSEIIDRRG